MIIHIHDDAEILRGFFFLYFIYSDDDYLRIYIDELYR